ncbi:PREDICTED: guanylate cyclase 32E, partial [Papilio polytes]|uniref:guanylate cyclase 32E n=1 Tax=Papilio polytes TaxID=76194 RepID=UPI000675BC2E
MVKTFTWAMWHWCWCLLISSFDNSRGEIFTLGYLTGSQRRPGDFTYERPGRVISGAISMAVDEVNEKLLGPMGHSLEFIVAETYGQEEVSIKQVAALWASNVSAFIGPQETCVHEGRMAAAFNLPMVSYFCRDVASFTHKRDYATFARTRPSDIDISRAVVAALTHFQFMHICVVYLCAPNHDYTRLAKAIIKAAKDRQITVLSARAYNQPYFYENIKENVTRNPFIDVVRETYKTTRIYVSVGLYHDHIGLMLALDSFKLLDSGEYAAIGVDVDKYEVEEATRYLSGPLRNEPSSRTLHAFRSYLAVAPSPSPSYPVFAREVNTRLQLPPFNFTNPLLKLGGGKVIRVEAAWLHDAVWVYARALATALSIGEDPRDGRALVQYIRNTTYRSVMGYWVHMDENGDAEGNYTLLSMDPDRPPGLYPLAVMHKNAPELRFMREMRWPGGRVPLSEPPCGFKGEKCVSHVGAWALGASGGTLALLALAALRVRRQHIDINREIKKELKIMRDLQHDNLNGFVGACIEPPNICALSEYCTRGSLKDILENEDIKLDNMFIASLVGDIIRGMIFIHESPLQYHGALRPSNCLVDARWVVKLADFGLREFRRGELPPSEPGALRAHIEGLLYLSPELLRAVGWGRGGAAGARGSPQADAYAFGLLLYELHARRGPFGSDAPPAPSLLRRLAASDTPPLRPPLEALSGRFDCVRECCTECWAEEPALRPDFKAIRARLRPLRKGMKPNIFDNMIAMMEKYANNLEALVDERTDQLQEEKKKTEALLEEMLPAPVAE